MLLNYTIVHIEANLKFSAQRVGVFVPARWGVIWHNLAYFLHCACRHIKYGIKKVIRFCIHVFLEQERLKSILNIGRMYFLR